MSLRVVLDTSTLVSAALRVGSVPNQSLMDALTNCEVCASAETLAELDAVLSRAKFDSYLGRETRRAFVSLFRRRAHIFVVPEEDGGTVVPACRDSTDNKFLALALAAGAGILVSSDDDLLVLHPWRGIAIVTPREFLDRSRAETKNEPDL